MWVQHPRLVLTLSRRLFALALTVLLSVGNGAVCAGWAHSPEARMACCADGQDCPMHKDESRSTASNQRITQAQADACCAASEREQSNQSNPTVVAAISSAVLGTGIVVPIPVPALVQSDAWRSVSPIPIRAVPKHVLLSVFLV
ncbi:MAG: hypothetical protein ACRDGM_13970 [bacterium]